MSSENKCLFVNSRGILKSCNFHSLNPKSSCNNDVQYLYDMLNSNKMFHGMTIYVCSDLLSFFVNNILIQIKHAFILVSGDSDLCVPIEALTQNETDKLINSPYLLRWYAQNTRMQNHNKLRQMPIGLDYHTIFMNPECNWKIEGEDILPGSQEQILKNILHKMKPFYERISKIYVNFSKISDRFKQREYSVKIIPKNLMEINDSFTPRTMNWTKMADYSFVLSPFGIGMDCHRTWEALCLGCIPIVCAPNFKTLFEDLPVLNVNNWKEINEEMLKETLNNFKIRKFNYEKLTLKYWLHKIKKAL